VHRHLRHYNPLCCAAAEVRSELKRLGRELGILILELVDELIERPSRVRQEG